MNEMVVDEANTLAELAAAPMSPKRRRRRKQHEAQLSFDFDAIDDIDAVGDVVGTDEFADASSGAVANAPDESDAQIPEFCGKVARSLMAGTAGGPPGSKRRFGSLNLGFRHRRVGSSTLQRRVIPPGADCLVLVLVPDSTADPLTP